MKIKAMNPSHVHLILNHFPIVGILLGLLLILIFFIKRNETVLIFGLLTFIIAGLITIPTFTSGEGAEVKIEHMQGIEESRIEKHEELAEKSLILIEGIALLSLIYLVIYFKRKKMNVPVLILLLLLAGGCTVLLLFVNNSGAEIRHTEIRNGY